MDLQRIHDNIITAAKDRASIDEYYERHHIIPSSLGGTNDAANIVLLTGKEHYIIHWILYRINPCPETAYAWHRMSYGPNVYHKGRITARKYDYARKAFAEEHSKNMRGRKLSVSHRQHLSESKMGSKNPMFGKTHSEEFKEKLRIQNTGENNPFFGKTHSDEVKAKLSQYAKERTGEKSNAHGNHHSEETKKYFSELYKGKPRAKPHEVVKCPHCGKEGIKPNMKRWHFDNCKVKNVVD